MDVCSALGITWTVELLNNKLHLKWPLQNISASHASFSVLKAMNLLFPDPLIIPDRKLYGTWLISRFESPHCLLNKLRSEKRFWLHWLKSVRGCFLNEFQIYRHVQYGKKDFKVTFSDLFLLLCAEQAILHRLQKTLLLFQICFIRTKLH